MSTPSGATQCSMPAAPNARLSRPHGSITRPRHSSAQGLLDARLHCAPQAKPDHYHMKTHSDLNETLRLTGVHGPESWPRVTPRLPDSAVTPMMSATMDARTHAAALAVPLRRPWALGRGRGPGGPLSLPARPMSQRMVGGEHQHVTIDSCLSALTPSPEYGSLPQPASVEDDLVCICHMDVCSLRYKELC
jgi:hypothetical protein